MSFVSFLIIVIYRILFCDRHVILQSTDSIRAVHNIRKDYPGMDIISHTHYGTVVIDLYVNLVLCYCCVPTTYTMIT